MRLEEIEELMHQMNQSKLAHSLPDESGKGNDPIEEADHAANELITCGRAVPRDFAAQLFSTASLGRALPVRQIYSAGS